MKIDIKKCKSSYYDEKYTDKSRVEYLCRTVKYGDWCAQTNRSPYSEYFKNNKHIITEQQYINMTQILPKEKHTTPKKLISKSYKT